MPSSVLATLNTNRYSSVNHVLERYFESTTLDKLSLGREAKLRNQQWVLSTTGYTLFNQPRHAPLLLTKAEKLCRLSVNPVFIFRELLIEIAQHKITRPGYSTFQKIISAALASEKKRINLIFKDHLSAQDQRAFLCNHVIKAPTKKL